MVVYCDMDGVLTDYDSAFTDLFGDQPRNVFPVLGEEEVNSIINQSSHFWYNMPWTKDGKELWSFLKPYSPLLLTTPALTVKTCKKDKVAWKDENLGKSTTIIFSNTKHDYASPEALLIDDNKENIEKFVRNGGLGILHTSAEETIQQFINITTNLVEEPILAKTEYFTIKQTPEGNEYNAASMPAAVCLPIRVVNDSVEVLVRKEHNPIRGHFYTLIGGGIEEGEEREQGIIRELQEEAGIIADTSQVYFVGDLVNDKYTKQKVALFFIILEDASKTTPATDGTTAEKKAVNFWLSLDEISSFILSVDDSFLLAALCRFIVTYTGI